MAKPQKKPQAPEPPRVVEPEIEMGEVPDSKPPGTNGRLILLQALLIVAAGLWVFWPALHGDWLWDDDGFITDNLQLRNLDGLWSLWFMPGTQLDYCPIVRTVVWLEWHLWHNETLGYHIVTLAMHLLNALLVWRLFDKMGLRLAWLGGLLFAIHPVQVESAAWIVEIKNTLSLPPLLLAMFFYLDYEERKKSSDYFLALGLFLVALLCKITGEMFPVVILLYAWWKRSRIGWNDLKASAPFFAASAAFGLLAIHLQNPGHENGAVETEGFFGRLLGVGMAVCFYLGKFLWPTGLLPNYPRWALDPPSLVQILPIPLLAALVFGLWTQRRSWGRHALLGFGFFLINLLPVLVFIMMSYDTMVWSLDHLVYLPMIGLVGLAVAGMGWVGERLAFSLRPLGMGIIAVIMALLAYESHSYAGMFINEETLCIYTLQLNPQDYLTHNNLGNVLLHKGLPAEAMEQYEEALRINPNYAKGHNNLGVVLLESGRVAEGLDQCEQALRINPDEVEAHNSLGVALSEAGRVPEAIEQFRQAVKLTPNDADAHYNLGFNLVQIGQIPEAIEQYERALLLKPDYAQAHNNLGVALGRTGRIWEATQEFERAIQIDPNYADARNNLARTQAYLRGAPEKK